jgi:phosphoribosylamine--glycine ligase
VRVLVVGSGGREHALAWKLAQSAQVTDLHAAPGNPGIAQLAELHSVSVDDISGMVELARRLKPDLVVVGPEAPLVAGLSDALREHGLRVFGPSAAAARIEGSKAFAREIMESAGVPTARALPTPQAPCVLKADGLASGKGVFVCPTAEDVELALPRVKEFGGEMLIEELLIGHEISVFALCDGESAVALPVAQDYKRLGNGDRGPNTGGMGSYSPADVPGGMVASEIVEQVHTPVLRELARRGTPFQGLLYAGLMATDDETIVLEFNCRFGDPETQSILPRIDSDLFELLNAAVDGELSTTTVLENAISAVTVVMASPGYPDSPRNGMEIHGASGHELEDVVMFHAGTALSGDVLLAAGGRVLNITGLGASIDAARENAYTGVASITFPDCQYRTDIAELAARQTI